MSRITELIMECNDRERIASRIAGLGIGLDNNGTFVPTFTDEVRDEYNTVSRQIGREEELLSLIVAGKIDPVATLARLQVYRAVVAQSYELRPEKGQKARPSLSL